MRILRNSSSLNVHPEAGWPAYRPLAAILVLAFSLRLLAVIFFTGAIDAEGAEYGRIAENLLSGKGYYGIANPGKELMFPPLFPFLIAAATVVTGNTELGGRLVSLVMGTLLVFPIFLITRHLFSQQAAYVAAALTALHPYLVIFSATVYCESTYLTLVLSGVYAALRGFQESSVRIHLLAGIAFGLAYLTRPEAAIYQFLTIGFTLAYVAFTNRQALRRTFLRLIWLPTAFACLAGPYVVWHHSQTGQWRLEGKSPLNFSVGRDMIAGHEAQYAQYGVDADLTERGVWIRSNLSTIQSTKITLRELIQYLRSKVKDDLNYLKGLPTHTSFGSPALFLLALYGLFRRPWNRGRAVSQVFLLVVLAVAGSALAFNYYYSDRFLLLFVPVFIVWASQGVMEFSRWTLSTIRMIRERAWAPVRRRWVVVGAIASVIPLLAVPVVYKTVHTYRETRTLKTAGQWLDTHAPGPKTVVDISTILSFHAGATFIPFPYCDSDVAIRYLDKRKVDFIVLSDYGNLSFRPYLNDWMESGPPGERAKLVWSAPAFANKRIFIYRWAPAQAQQNVLTSMQ
jgi:4-amino-4-deoxy-L-arabinose transferase-like glycosyltransferase